ncbi:MAG TPA: tRNA 2-selenouridine(34) synthase MnmH [Planctomycetota bacterium]|nr:tRNA 2-selenouridine(34) synthase MnmH [Planctomycetota bacterium]
MILTAPNFVPTISAAAALSARGAVIVDLRSPAEFAADHLPGAFNVPLFDDAERAIVGTLYNRDSPDAALAAGRSLVRVHIDALIGEIARLARWKLPPVDLASRLDDWTSGSIDALDRSLSSAPCESLPEKPIVLHCWRGGLRSRSVTSFLRALGLDRAVALEGGYKGYREWVRDSLATWIAPPVYVLRGFTGVGKTLVLGELERLRRGWTIDLEALAGHRGSVLGMVGLEPCTQKTFESRVFARLSQGFPAAAVLEGEGRKVGNASLPPRLWAALDAGTNLELTASLDRRVEVLTRDYLERPENRPAIAAELPFLEQRLGKVKFDGVLTSMFAQGRDRELVLLLLERYYDPLYRQSEKGRVYAARFDAGDPSAAAAEIAHWIEARL